MLAAPLLLLLLLLAGRFPGTDAFNLLPKLPSFRHHFFFQPATPAPSERGSALSTSNLSPGGDSGGAGPDDTLPGGASSLVDVARRRFWRWTVWRRLYHSSVVTVLKQQTSPVGAYLPSFTRRRSRLDSVYTKPTPFLFSTPDAGPVTVASSGYFNSVHLVTRAAAPEQKSLVYVNGTEVSGHLRSGVVLPSPPPLRASSAAVSSAAGGPTATVVKSDAPLSLSLMGEFCVDKPAYLHIAPTKAGATPLLWVTQFSLTRRGSVTGINIFDSCKKQGTSAPLPAPPRAAAAPAAAAETPEEMKLGFSFRWPNEVYNLPPGTINGAAEEALVVADGFLMPGRSDGGVYVVQDPGKPSERVTSLTRHRPGWFYHKATWVDLMGSDGRKCLLTARATKPFFAQTEGELVLLLQPEGPFPLAEWNTPWEEIVLAKGPDVMFDVVDLDPTDDVLEVFAAEFFSRRLTLHRIRKGDWRTGKLPRVLTSEVLDDTLGPAYSVVLADLKGRGRPSHVLVSSHECQYEGIVEGPAPDSTGSFSSTTAAAAALTGVRDGDLSSGGRFSGPGLQGAAGRPFVGASGSNGSGGGGGGGSNPLAPDDDSEILKGGSLFAYEIPSNWRERVPWKRSVLATGFHVRSWGQINPGAPGFPYVFYPHRSLQGQPGQRPYILLAGDCSHAAYIYRPVGGEEELGYEPMAQINCGGTVGSLAVGYLPLVVGDGEVSEEAADGWAKIFVPNFDTDKVYTFSFGPEKVSAVSPLDPPTVPSEPHLRLEAERKARVAEEDEVLSAASTYGKARGDKTKIS